MKWKLTLAPIVIGIIFIVSILVLRIPFHPRKISNHQTCAMHIEEIEGAKQMWMIENKKSDTDVATEDDLKPILKNGVFPVCPQGGTYSINANNVRATCSFHPLTVVKQ